jgi:hypothetical protein
MRDTDLRGIVLQQFYDDRRKGMLGLGVENITNIQVPHGADEQDVLRVCDQLGDSGLLEWHGIEILLVGVLQADVERLPGTALTWWNAKLNHQFRYTLLIRAAINRRSTSRGRKVVFRLVERVANFSRASPKIWKN